MRISDRDKKVKKYSEKFRYIGAWFALWGVPLFIASLVYLFDPELMITINGIATNDVKVKLLITLSTFLLSLLGLSLMFGTKKYYGRMYNRSINSPMHTLMKKIEKNEI